LHNGLHPNPAKEAEVQLAAVKKCHPETGDFKHPTSTELAGKL
jgi:hypothetical protein